MTEIHQVFTSNNRIILTPYLNDNELMNYTMMAKSMMESVLEATSSQTKLSWELAHEKNGISVYRCDGDNNSPCNIHATCNFKGNIDEISKSMFTDSTESYAKMMRYMSDEFLDGAVLHTIIPRTRDHPFRYVGIKWASFKGNSPFIKDKNYIFLEYMDMIKNEPNKTIVFRVLKSVSLSDTQDNQDGTLKLSEMPLTGFIYSTIKESLDLKISYTCNFDQWGDLPSWAANSAIQVHVEQCIDRTIKFMNKNDLPHEVFLVNENSKNKKAQRCSICDELFMCTRHRHTCVECKSTICNHCSSSQLVNIQLLGSRYIRLCSLCFHEFRKSTTAAHFDVNRGIPMGLTLNSKDFMDTKNSCSFTCDIPECKKLFQSIQIDLLKYQEFSSSGTTNQKEFLFSDSNQLKEKIYQTHALDLTESLQGLSLQNNLNNRKQMNNHREEEISRHKSSLSSLSEFQKLLDKVKNDVNKVSIDVQSIDESMLQRQENKDDTNTKTSSNDIHINHQQHPKLHEAIEKSQELLQATSETKDLAHQARDFAYQYISRSKTEVYVKNNQHEGLVQRHTSERFIQDKGIIIFKEEDLLHPTKHSSSINQDMKKRNQLKNKNILSSNQDSIHEPRKGMNNKQGSEISLKSSIPKEVGPSIENEPDKTWIKMKHSYKVSSRSSSQKSNQYDRIPIEEFSSPNEKKKKREVGCCFFFF